MRFLLDECLPHSFVQKLAALGHPDAVHPIHIGMRGAEDYLIVRTALAQDRVIVTANADDFRMLLAKETLHPGLICLPNAEFDVCWRLLIIAINFIELQPQPEDYMVNRVVEVSGAVGIRPYLLPE
jgi:predicted nuclease of predicted toxin-antitoxin system